MTIGSPDFKHLYGIEYFSFEDDFVEKNIRCIPMIVRFKMDHAGIKLKLAEWSKFSMEERLELAKRPCSSDEQVKSYNEYLAGLVKKYTGKEATVLTIERNPGWANTNEVPVMLNEKLKEFDWLILADQWKGLTNLQRFALVKLCKEGHENVNFPKAMKEFKLVG